VKRLEAITQEVLKIQSSNIAQSSRQVRQVRNGEMFCFIYEIRNIYTV